MCFHSYRRFAHIRKCTIFTRLKLHSFLRELITCELLCVRKRVTSFYSKRVCLYETVCACLCLCVIEGVYGSCCPWPDLFGKALIDVELPPHRVLSGHEDLAAGSTNPGALNSAICPAMCSHLPAGSTQHRSCLIHWVYVRLGPWCSRVGPEIQLACYCKLLLLLCLVQWADMLPKLWGLMD